MPISSNLPGIQPCPYTVYRFYDFADHDSDIIQSSNAPEFNDVRTYPVPMTEELDSYLRAAVRMLCVVLSFVVVVVVVTTGLFAQLLFASYIVFLLTFFCCLLNTVVC